ncbi:MAG: hypothetical protein ACLFQC_12270, partial [Wenzhouxiangella sp.]
MSVVRRWGGLLLMALGLFGLVVATLAGYASLRTHQALAAAETEAHLVARRAADALSEIQQILAGDAFQRIVLEHLETPDTSPEALLQQLRLGSLNEGASLRMLSPALEDWTLEDAADYAAMDMLVEARRSGAAAPELRPGDGGNPPELMFAQRLGEADQVEAVVLLTLPAASIAGNWPVPSAVDFISLGQQRGARWIEVWSHGQAAGQPSGRMDA